MNKKEISEQNKQIEALQYVSFRTVVIAVKTFEYPFINFHRKSSASALRIKQAYVSLCILNPLQKRVKCLK